MFGILASDSPMHHVLDEVYLRLGDHGPVVFSKHIAMQILAATLLLLILPSVFGKHALVPRGVRNFFEAICVYIREEVARPVLKDQTDRFLPYLWTAFFFILFMNLLGLIPFGASATGNIWVTASLACCTMVMMVVNGLRLQGKHYIAHFCPGPLWLAPLLVPVEIIGLGAKIFALSVRLFANMIAGHILLAVLLSFIGVALKALGGGGYAIAGIVVVGSVVINMLELFVAFLQAFIFTFLSTLFIAQSVVIEHHDHDHDHDGHGHGHGKHDLGKDHGHHATATHA